MHWPLWRVAVAESSMEPTLRPGDWLLAWRGWGWALARSPGGERVRIRPGQIVVARHPREPGRLLVKRVAWREPDGWWLDSDNPRAGAIDSARFGPVPAGLIEARVLARYWPPGSRRAESAGRGATW